MNAVNYMRVPHEVFHCGQLPMVELTLQFRGGGNQAARVGDFFCFLRKVFVKGLDCFANDIELMIDEISEIVVIRFRVQISPCILCWRLFEYARDRGKLDQPISALCHRPIKERSRRSSITVYKGVYPANHEMDCNGFDQRMNERAFVFSIGKIT